MVPAQNRDFLRCPRLFWPYEMARATARAIFRAAPLHICQMYRVILKSSRFHKVFFVRFSGIKLYIGYVGANVHGSTSQQD